MSMNFGSNNIPPFKAQASYKDGGGMGGGGMYFQQRKDEDEEDVFERKEDEGDIFTEGKIDMKDIPTDNLFNKFINWFKQKS